MSSRPQISIPGFGSVQGIQSETRPSVAKFLNIPYATVVERWRPAVRPATWSGVRDCSELGPACPQPSNPNPLANLTNDPDVAELLSKIHYSERDCLNLNVFAPLEHLTKANTLVPVMVWVHGGGFSTGSNSSPVFDGTNFVARSIQFGRPIILVVINYRLNYLGFMSSEEIKNDIQQSLPSSSSSSSSIPYTSKSVGNWGLLDQKMAFEWVKDHIHVFGGNPNDVTAFGESAGAVSIAYHLVISQHHGLFHRAIMQSGAMNTMPAGRCETEGQRFFEHLYDHHFKSKDKAGQSESGSPVTTSSSSSSSLSGQEKLARLKSIPAIDLVKAGDNGRIGMFIPTIDNILIHDDPRATVHQSHRYDPGLKSVMLGDCRDEGTVFVPMMGAKSMKRWDKFYSRYCTPTEKDRKLFQEIYGLPQNDWDAKRISSDVMNDAIFCYPTFETSMALMNTRGNSNGSNGSNNNKISELEMVRYHFDRPSKLLIKAGFKSIGVFHGSEVPFVFGSDASRLAMSREEKNLSDRMIDLWILFAWNETTCQYRLRHDTRSLLPRDHSNGGGLWQEAIIFSEDCTVELGQVERMDQRKIEYWTRYEEYTRQRRANKHASYAKNLNDAKTESRL
ncbi:hypothetical protein BGZ76_006513 [Entomortierella beljakovae]|nr:hypothetical protein BGZ76_006513 [Entomortierella beljakovae]